MRIKNNIICSVCVLMAIVLFWAASTRLDPLNDSRQELNLISNTAIENAPPSLAFATVAMGAFRGLIVDVLWMRADRLKEEGQFYDAKHSGVRLSVLRAVLTLTLASNNNLTISVCPF